MSYIWKGCFIQNTKIEAFFSNGKDKFRPHSLIQGVFHQACQQYFGITSGGHVDTVGVLIHNAILDGIVEDSLTSIIRWGDPGKVD